jgi:hypothetical protein
LVPLPAKSCPSAENLKTLFAAEKCGKSYAQWRNLASFVFNGPKFKKPSEIKPPLLCNMKEVESEKAQFVGKQNKNVI